MSIITILNLLSGTSSISLSEEGINVGLVIFGGVTYPYILFMILVLLSWELFTDVGGLLGLDFQNDYFSQNRIIMIFKRDWVLGGLRHHFPLLNWCLGKHVPFAILS